MPVGVSAIFGFTFGFGLLFLKDDVSDVLLVGDTINRVTVTGNFGHKYSNFRYLIV